MSYIFGGDTGLSPQALENQRRLAKALMERKTGTPRNVGEGLTAVGQAIAARMASNKAEKMGTKLNEQRQSVADSLFEQAINGYNGSNSSYSGSEYEPSFENPWNMGTTAPLPESNEVSADANIFDPTGKIADGQWDMGQAAVSPEIREMLAKTLMAEAGGEGLEGMIAAGAVINNRVQDGGYGDGFEGVIMKPGQFSAWNGVTNYANGEGALDMANITPNEDALKATDMILSGRFEDPTNGATHYYNPAAANPKWGMNAGGDWARIGNHVFGRADAGREVMSAKNNPTTNLGMIGGAKPDGTFWQSLDGNGQAHAANPNYND
jgi:spore germination cell wall hydrolase CwlJ-like protein